MCIEQDQWTRERRQIRESNGKSVLAGVKYSLFVSLALLCAVVNWHTCTCDLSSVFITVHLHWQAIKGAHNRKQNTRQQLPLRTLKVKVHIPHMVLGHTLHLGKRATRGILISVVGQEKEREEKRETVDLISLMMAPCLSFSSSHIHERPFHQWHCY